MSKYNNYSGSPTKCADELPCLDVTQLKKLGLLNAWWFEWKLSYLDGRESILSITVTDKALIVTKGTQDFIVNLLRIAQNYGGFRVRFECPQCKHEALKVYEFKDSVACRACCGHTYRSHRLTKSERLRAKAHKINQQLGWLDAPLCEVNEKPSHLRAKTLERLLAERDRLIYEASGLDMLKIVQKFKLESMLLGMLNDQEAQLSQG